MRHVTNYSRLLIARKRYAEIRNLYVDQLAHVWVGDSADATRVRVEKKIDSFVEGDLEHATEMLSALWKIANKDGNITAPSNPSPVVSSLFACILPSATWSAQSTLSGRAGHESCPLALCQDCAHKVDPHRGIL